MAKLAASDALTIPALQAGFQSGQWTPIDVVEECLKRIDDFADPATWIDLFPREEILAQARAAADRLASGDQSPLLGVPFAIKDNIDMAGHATTAACPQFSYRPARSATVVAKLLDAGAIAVGKTNLDQFATGLVGTRSPYGTPRNPFNADYIPGGSSSGSAVAVAAGLVSFSLGTDTAGSGRVPAAFNNIVGLKPSCGRLSTAGVVPACRSLDCVSVFALTCDDAAQVMSVAEGFDPQDPYSRTFDSAKPLFATGFRFGVPAASQLNFFGNVAAAELFQEAVARLEKLGGKKTLIDLAPFLAAGDLLYEGPWVAERLAGLREFLASEHDAVLPVTREILHSGRRFDAVAAFDGYHELRCLKRLAAAEWEKMDLLVLPTTGTIYSRAEIEADPFGRNANLGRNTTFVNLLDLSAVAVPGGFLPNGLPLGITLMAPAGYELPLLDLGGRFHRSTASTLGATRWPLPAQQSKPPISPPHTVQLAVVGAHLAGQPLNHQLTNLQATLVRSCRTADSYRLYALPNTQPPKPGLLRTTDGTGSSIAVEVWEMSAEAFGRFVAAIPSPMGICTVTLEDGTEIKGFTCEACAVAGGRDITDFGGWRNFLASL